MEGWLPESLLTVHVGMVVSGGGGRGGRGGGGKLLITPWQEDRWWWWWWRDYSLPVVGAASVLDDALVRVVPDHLLLEQRGDEFCDPGQDCMGGVEHGRWSVPI